MEYKNTIITPKTAFPMKAGLPNREPGMLEAWNDMDLYGQLLEKNRDCPRFILHDGPPFSNGGLHMGHALDCTLQDILTRFKRMQGYAALWVPGTDHAGIATQIKVEEELRKNEGLTRYDLGREKFLERVWGLEGKIRQPYRGAAEKDGRLLRLEP